MSKTGIGVQYGKVKPENATLWYGNRPYPVQEGNLEQLAVDLDEALEGVRKAMSKLSGGHYLDDEPYVDLSISGNGYTVVYRFGYPELGRDVAEPLADGR